MLWVKMKTEWKTNSQQHIQGEHIQSYCIKELFMALQIAGACLFHKCSVHNCNWTGGCNTQKPTERHLSFLVCDNWKWSALCLACEKALNPRDRSRCATRTANERDARLQLHDEDPSEWMVGSWNYTLLKKGCYCDTQRGVISLV